MKRCTTILLVTTFLLGISNRLQAQVPCGFGTGFDPCFAEFLTVAGDCPSASQEFRVNICGNSYDPGVGCGSDFTGNEVWGTFTTGSATNITITWSPTNSRDIALHLFSVTDPCGIPAFTELACADANGAGIGAAGEEVISITLAPTTTYYVMGECLSHSGIGAGSTICVVESGGGGGGPVTASDCSDAVNVCTNLSFTINPNGAGLVSEIPASGSLGNPYYDGITPMPWGSLNLGCLQSDETNSTWMIINVQTGGDLEFTFGGGGAQAGFYDWIMYPHTSATVCTDISSNSLAPVRCNWNGIDAGGTGLANTVPAGGDAMNFEPALAVLAGERYMICFSNYSSVSTSVPLDFGGTAVVDCSALPVELLGFDAFLAQSEETREVTLQWATASETMNDKFVVERSLDGNKFEPIDTVIGQGTTIGRTEYTSRDLTPRFGLNYYRLKQLDYNGTFSYSNVVSVDVLWNLDPIVLPNPFTDQCALVAPLSLDNEGWITLTDVFGRQVHFEPIQSIQSRNDLDLSDIPTGLYWLTFYDGEKMSVMQVVKR